MRESVCVYERERERGRERERERERGDLALGADVIIEVLHRRRLLSRWAALFEGCATRQNDSFREHG